MYEDNGIVRSSQGWVAMRVVSAGAVLEPTEQP